MGEPPHVLQPSQVQVLKSKSPPNIRHLLASEVLVQLLPNVTQQPPWSTLPGGQWPSKLSTVQLPGVGRLHEKCSELTSRHRLPPVTVAPAVATPTLNETCAFA